MKAKFSLILCLGMVASVSATFPAQTSTRGQTVRPSSGQANNPYEASYAFVVGVSDYTNGWEDLPGVLTDVPAVKMALETHGFVVTTLLNPTRAQLDERLGKFISQYGQNSGHRLLFYYAGHGYTLKSNADTEIGYIVPADAPRPGASNLGEFKRLAISMRQMESYIEQIDARHALFVFDSCFAGTIFKTRGRALPEAISDKIFQPVRQFIAAGTATQKVLDQSPFRRAFVAGLAGAADTTRGGYITGSEFGEYLHGTVTDATKGAQTPQHGKSTEPQYTLGDFVFFTPNHIPIVLTAPPRTQNTVTQLLDPAALELELWQSAQKGNTLADYEEYQRQYPSGRFIALARNRIKQIQASTNTGSNSNNTAVENHNNAANTLNASGKWSGTILGRADKIPPFTYEMELSQQNNIIEGTSKFIA